MWNTKGNPLFRVSRSTLLLDFNCGAVSLWSTGYLRGSVPKSSPCRDVHKWSHWVKNKNSKSLADTDNKWRFIRLTCFTIRSFSSIQRCTWIFIKKRCTWIPIWFVLCSNLSSISNFTTSILCRDFRCNIILIASSL